VVLGRIILGELSPFPLRPSDAALAGRHVKTFFAMLGALAAGVLAAAPPAAPAAGPVEFVRDIQPIFAQHCYSCHGPEKPKGGLRLDRKPDALAGGDSGRVIVPGRSAASLLVHLVGGLDPDRLMPPKGERLTPKQISLLRAWIDQGAAWPEDSPLPTPTKHWAFKAPARPEPPKVKNGKWVRNPVDHFVLARLEREKVRPSAEADRATLLRRLHLDLTGLPPTPAELEAFQKDRRPDAYGHLVDRLLASPHFGERWGRHWLDLARYADSDGYQLDYVRPWACAHRDWVINSFNRDQPFDQFTIEQLAGDLLPNATIEQRVATGFHRHTLVNNEDGVDKEEYRCKATVDRVSTTGAVWLGLTVGCAECHSHKYDPISQREFYQLYAFFNRAEEENFNVTTNAQAGGFRQTTNAVKTFVHVRGDFLRRGEEVQPGVLAVLNPLNANGDEGTSLTTSPPPNRLDLARWLVHPANPLTARVEVNRLWQHLFGRGLVGTPDDFGTRGEPPSHPELLDWLATEFIKRGWSRKEMIRLIVTSASYRQSSHLRPELLERDPQNILLARQNRFRVEAEIVRDAHLAASGLLNPALGGPSIRPPMPADLHKIGYVDRNVPWVESTGAARHRRGLYVQTQRTVQYPVPATFDAANPSESCPRRERSNTPLQALTLLNNPVFFECALALARRMDSAGGGNPREMLRHGFKLCLCREPVKLELDRLEKLFAQELRSAQTNPEAAKLSERTNEAKNGVARNAALVAVAQTLMNLDEFLTRE